MSKTILIPQHNLPDGTWCPWSGCETTRPDGLCPDRCQGKEGTAKCFHITTAEGRLYRVAAADSPEATRMVLDCLMREEPAVDRPGAVHEVGTWDVDRGTIHRIS